MIQIRVGPIVRAISANTAVIWAEFAQPCSVILTVTHETFSTQSPTSVKTHTITIGGHHYAAPQVQGLQAAQWYNYQIEASEDEAQVKVSPGTPGILQCFRTLEDTDTITAHSLRIFYGSCRRLTQPEAD